MVTTRRTPSGRGRAHRRACPDKEGTRLALDWRAHDNAPPWARRHSAEAWSTLLAPTPARHGWSPRDLNQLITDWLATGHRIPDNLHKPIGLLGAILTGHGGLDERPTAADEARVREELRPASHPASTGAR